MSDYDDLVQRLEKPIARLVSFTVPPIYEPDPLHIEAADAIRELVASLRKVMEGERYERERAEKAEEVADFSTGVIHKLKADLAAEVETRKEALREAFALQAERDDAERLAFDIDGSRRLLEGRLALAEADLSAARAALRYADEEKGISWIPKHAPAIAAARAE